MDLAKLWLRPATFNQLLWLGELGQCDPRAARCVNVEGDDFPFPESLKFLGTQTEVVGEILIRGLRRLWLQQGVGSSPAAEQGGNSQDRH
jgi:hypothetical protein